MGSQLGRMRPAPHAERHAVARSGGYQPRAAGAAAPAGRRVPGRCPLKSTSICRLQGEPLSPQETQIVSLGVVLFTYLRLKLHLRIAGFAPVFHDYDWRLGVDELGRGLADAFAASARA